MIGTHTTFPSGFTGRSGLGRYTSRLEIGVEVFFVISGFLLYRPFAVDHFGGRPALRLGSFWLRRAKRIIPAYWVAFLVITYVLRADTVVHSPVAPLVYLGFAQIYMPHYVLTGVTQAWSLCTEMSFYLTLPLYAWLVGRGRPRTPAEQLRVEMLGLGVLVALGFAYRIPVLTVHSTVTAAMSNWLPGFFDQFALGMFLAVTSAYLAASSRRPAWLWHPALPWISWAIALGAFVAVSNVGLPLTPVTPSPLGLSLARQALYGTFAFFVVAPAVFGSQDDLARRILRLKPLALIGVVSYGVYLWHEAWIHMFLSWTHDRLFTIPWPDLLGTVTALSIASAAISYIGAERPILRWRPARPPQRPPQRPRQQPALAGQGSRPSATPVGAPS